MQNFAFAFIDPTSFKVAPMSDADTEMYPRFTGLKEANPGLKTWISIGGWSMNDPEQPTARTFSNLAGSKDAQAKFFSSLLNFMSTYGFVSKAKPLLKPPMTDVSYLGWGRYRLGVSRRTRTIG